MAQSPCLKLEYKLDEIQIKIIIEAAVEHFHRCAACHVEAVSTAYPFLPDPVASVPRRARCFPFRAASASRGSQERRNSPGGLCG